MTGSSGNGTKQGGGRRLVVWLALAGNVAIAISKFVAAAFTGSAAMLSEGVHSLVDCSNELLLMYGMRRSRRPPDRIHPLGHDRELYFWSFVVALMIFALGASISVYEGVQRIRHPEPIAHFVVSLAVLGVSFVFELVSWTASLRELLRQRRESQNLLATIRESKDPTVFTVFLEDSAALIGLVVAATGISLAHAFDAPMFDAAGSIAIGALLGATSLFLAGETKALLIGEQATPRVRETLIEIASGDPAVERANAALTVQLGPERVVAAISAEFGDALRTDEIEAAVRRIETRIRARYPEVSILFVKPEAHDASTLAPPRGDNAS